MSKLSRTGDIVSDMTVTSSGAPRAWSVDRYLDDVLAPIGSTPQLEQMGLAQAWGRTLGRDIRAAIDVPRFDNSAMDGFGIAFVPDCPSRAFEVVADVPAGATAAQPPKPGKAVRIMTGAPIPPGVDTVVPLEDAAMEGTNVRFTRPVRQGQNVRLDGEDIRAGDLVVRRGTVLSARHLAAAAEHRLGRAARRTALSASAMPGTVRLSSGTNASGVTSPGARPVPPVVTMTSQPPATNSSTAARMPASSSGTIRHSSAVAPAPTSASDTTGPDMSCRSPRNDRSKTVITPAFIAAHTPHRNLGTTTGTSPQDVRTSCSSAVTP